MYNGVHSHLYLTKEDSVEHRLDDHLRQADEDYSAGMCRLCDQPVASVDEPAFDVHPQTGKCYEQPVHQMCAWLEQSGHDASEIKVAMAPEEIVAPLPI